MEFVLSLELELFGMKFPKNRTNLYVVVRIGPYGTALLGSFSDTVEADNFKDACASEWFEKTGGIPAAFDVWIVSFYG